MQSAFELHGTDTLLSHRPQWHSDASPMLHGMPAVSESAPVDCVMLMIKPEPEIFHHLLGVRVLMQHQVRAHRHDQPATHRHLVEERLGHAGSARGHQDRLIGRVLGPAQAAVALEHVDVVVSELGQPTARGVGQLPDPLDRVHLARDPGQDGRAVAGAAARLARQVELD